ncbi:MAG: serine--tRNA ligase [Candidatus Uhrbacteria bacterium]
MLDIQIIRDDPKLVKQVAKDKNVDVDIDEILVLDKNRKNLLVQVEELNSARKTTADKMKGASETEKKSIASQGKEIKKQLAEIEPSLRETEDRLHELMLRTPNIPSEDTPVGKDESHNIEISKWGQPPKFDFKAKDHLELAQNLNLLDTERGTKVAGFRGYFLKNELMMMHMGLMILALDRLRQKGFEVMSAPTIVRDMALIGSGHFPGDRDEIYEVQDREGEGDHETKYLAGTSEPSLLAYHADEILDESDLPIKLGGFSSCYRREVGGYGKDTKGIYRVHEFLKVEQVLMCKNDINEGLKWLEEIRQNSEQFLQELELPYRVIQICTGDMGVGKHKMYDIETWMPSRGTYGETHSASYLTDWQARRIGIRYRDKEGKIKFVHTLNNTLVASPRILIAILENNQQADGSVKIPKILQPYMGKREVIKSQ